MIEFIRQIFSNPILAAITGYLISLMFEYLVWQPILDRVKTDRSKLTRGLAMSLSLFVPMLILQWLAVQLTRTINSSLSMNEPQRVNIGSNIYAMFALFWGMTWIVLFRPLLSRLFNSGSHD
jgi:hypothetical protein